MTRGHFLGFAPVVVALAKQIKTSEKGIERRAAEKMKKRKARE